MRYYIDYRKSMSFRTVRVAGTASVPDRQQQQQPVGAGTLLD